MANVIRHKTSQPTKRGLRRGDAVVGTGEENYGPTSTTGYVNGITPPDGGYVVYTLGIEDTPAIYVANSDEELVDIAKTIANKNVHPFSTDIYSWITTANRATLSRDTIESPVGNTPLKMDVTGNDPYTNTYGSSPWNIADAKAGETWHVSCWVKASQPCDGHFFMFGANDAGSYGATNDYGSNVFDIETEWQRFSFSRTFSNANVGKIQVRLDGPDSGFAGTTVWWDGLQIERSSGVSYFRNNPGNINTVVEAKDYLASVKGVWMLSNVPNNNTTDGLIAHLNSGRISSFVDNDPTVNLINNPQFTTFSNVVNGDASIVQENFGDGKIGLKFTQFATANIVSFQPSVASFTPTSGGTYTFSADVRSTTTGKTLKNQVSVYVDGVRHWLQDDWTWTTSTYENGNLLRSNVAANTWQRYSVTFTMPTGTLTNFSISGWYRRTSNFVTEIANLQLEEKSTATSFVDGTRSQNTTVYDLSGVGNDGVLQNGTVFNNGVWELDGVNDRVDFNTNYPSSGTDPFSIDITFMIPADATWYNQGSGTAIIGRGSYAGSIGIFRGGTEGNVSFWVRLNGGNIYDPYVTGVARDVYHRIVGTFDGSDTAKIYHNGQYISQEVNVNNAGTLDAGSYLIGGGVAFGGNNGGYGQISVSDVKVYNKALSAAEVSRNFYNGPIVTDGLVFGVDPGNLVSLIPGEVEFNSLTGSLSNNLTNGPAYSKSNGGIVNFDGVNDTVVFALTGINLDSECTIEGWVRRNSTPTAWRTFFNIKSASANTPFFEFRSNSNAQHIYADYYNGTDNVTTAASLPTGDWGHALATYDGNGNIKMYFNGQLVGTKTGVAAFALGNNPRLTVGRAYSNDRYTDISIGPIRVYNRALTSNEALQNYNAQKARFGL